MTQAAISCALVVTLASGADMDQWRTYGADNFGERYSPLSQVSARNVAQLTLAWTYHTGALNPQSALNRLAAFEATPILSDGFLYLSSPFDDVIALDAASGRERWRYSARVDRSLGYSMATSRGVAIWLDSRRRTTSFCRKRVFIGTLDAKLI